MLHVKNENTYSRTMEDVMAMMEENEEGKLEFPRDLMVEDCFSSGIEQLYGFVTNVTIPEERLEPCLVDIECFENGTLINSASLNNEQMIDNTTILGTDPLVMPSILKKQGDY